MSAAPQDWFSQNAPKQGAGDWFAQNAPSVAPNAGLAPPAGSPATQPMEPSHLAQALNPATSSSSAIANPQQPAEQFALDNPEQQGKLAVAAGIGAAGTGLPVAAPAIAKVAARHPFISNVIGSAAISQARNIPVVGKYIPPMAEMLPWMRTVGGAAESEPIPPIEQGPRFPSGNMRATEGEYMPPQESGPNARPRVAPSQVVTPRALPESGSVARDLPYRRGPGEVAPEEVGSADANRLAVRVPPRGNGRLLTGRTETSAPYRYGPGEIPPEDVSAPDPTVLAGKKGVIVPRPEPRHPQRALPPAPEIAKPEAKTVTAIHPPPRSEWPPPEPTGAYDKPVVAPRGISDLRDDEAVREDIRDRVGQADRKVFASHRERNDVSVPKGVLTGQIDKPVQYTKSRIAKVTSSAPVAVATPETDDLTPLLKKSLRLARRGKKVD